MLKLLLVSSAYACIVQVVHGIKKDPHSIPEERRQAVTLLQSALEHIIPVSEQRLKNTSMNLAKVYYEKVSHCFATLVHVHILLWFMHQ